jgi:hypothetical protein
VTEVVVTLESAPQEAPEQPEPASDQVTPLSAESFWTAAVKPVDCETRREAEVGLMETEIGGAAAETVTAAEADLVSSLTEVAVRDTESGDGAAAGAV